MKPLCLALFLAASAFLFSACSSGNREGPNVTCDDLGCGRINACQEGIIAQCADGVNVKFHACALSTVCEASWQTEGAYRCEEVQTDCEGCRPEKLGCGEIEGDAGGADGMLPG